MMNKCPHCKGELKKDTRIKQWYCDFCDMIVTPENTKMYPLRGAVDYVDAVKPTRELMKYHSFDLLLLLGFVRKERRSSYDLMQCINRAKHLDPTLIEAAKEAFQQYDYWTRKVRCIESLVQSRLGFVPKAVTKELLYHFYDFYQRNEAKYA